MARRVHTPVAPALWSDSNLRVYHATDQDKRFRFSAAGLTPGAERELIVPDDDGTIALLDDITAAISTIDLSSRVAKTGDTMTGILTFSATQPQLLFSETDHATADESIWSFFLNSGDLRIRQLNDALSSAIDPLIFRRNGMAAASLELASLAGSGDRLVQAGAAGLVSASNTLTGNLTINKATPAIWLTDTGAAVDEKNTRIFSTGGQTRIQFWDDAIGSSGNAMVIDRVGVIAGPPEFPGLAGVGNRLVQAGASGLLSADNPVAGGQDVGTLTIAAGVVTLPTIPETVTNLFARIDTEAAAASDDLTDINVTGTLAIGTILTISTVTSARNVTVIDTGDLRIKGDLLLETTNACLTLMYLGTGVWLELSRSDNHTPGSEVGIIQSSAYNGADAATAQKLFSTADAPNGSLAIASGQAYFLEMVFRLQSTGTVSASLSLLFAGTATISTSYNAITGFTSTAGGISTSFSNVWVTSTAATAIVGASGTVQKYWYVTVHGIIRCTAGGTLIPQYQLSAAPGAAPSTLANSYVRLTPFGQTGSSTATSFGIVS